jgi:hypothetical protein
MKFEAFPKISRYSREVIITEKLDGTNAQIYISGDTFLTGSRTRWITPDDDNFGFAAWALENKEELLKLGNGRHYGEWWGMGIQRKYGLKERRFSLFNTVRWNADNLPACCHLVPVLYRGIFRAGVVEEAMERLKISGSHAAAGFMNPEGIVLWHADANMGLKKTFEKDAGKGGFGL